MSSPRYMCWVQDFAPLKCKNMTHTQLDPISYSVIQWMWSFKVTTDMYEISVQNFSFNVSISIKSARLCPFKEKNTQQIKLKTGFQVWLA